MRRAAPILAAAATGAAAIGLLAAGDDGATTDRPPAACDPGEPVLALVVREPRRRQFMVRLDPLTLEPISPRLRVRGEVLQWAISPDGRRLALAGSRARIVDLERWRMGEPLRITRRLEWPRALAWAGRDRLLVFHGVGRGGTGVAVIDARTRGVVRRRRLPGEMIAAAATGRGAAVLAAAPERIARARLAWVDRRGVVRSRPLPGVMAGYDPPSSNLRRSGDDPVARHLTPGLAVDRAGHRAFVVAADRPLVVEVDLRTGETERHSVEPRRSLAARLRDWLEPPAEAKLVSGGTRAAAWLGGGRLAVSGADTEVREEVRPHGLRLIDTDDWTEKVLEPEATELERRGGTLLAWRTGAGGWIAAFDRDGELRFRLQLRPRDHFVSAAGCQAYVGSAYRTRVVDLRAGLTLRILDRSDEDPPRLLHR